MSMTLEPRSLEQLEAELHYAQSRMLRAFEDREHHLAEVWARELDELRGEWGERELAAELVLHGHTRPLAL